MRFHCGQIEARRSRDASRFITTAWLCRTEGAASRTTRRIAFAVVGLAALSGMFRSAERSAARGVPVSDHVTVRIRRWLCPIKSRWRLMKRGHASWGADPARLPVPGRVSGAVRRSAAMSSTDERSGAHAHTADHRPARRAVYLSPHRARRPKHWSHARSGRLLYDAGASAIGGRARPRSDAHVRARLGTKGGSEQMLTEARVILPGAQALLGFYN